MVAALIVGKKNSRIPNKNIRPIRGIFCAEYAFIAAKKSRYIDRIFTSTDCNSIKEIALRYDSVVIDRPPELSTSTALMDDVLTHLMLYAGSYEYFVLFFCNVPTIDVQLLDDGIDFLQENKEWDSAFSVSQFNMFLPGRARKIIDKQIVPFVDPKIVPPPNSLRDSQGDCYYPDFAIQIMHRRCIENIDVGPNPWPWMGLKSYALINKSPTFDIDEEWQLPVIEMWLEKHNNVPEK